MGQETDKIMSAQFPANLDQFIGQERVVETLLIAIYAAKNRYTPLPHTLIYGPPGLGKSTIATCTANTLGVPIYYAIGSKIRTKKDVDEVIDFIKMRMHAMVFLDEIHAMPKKLEELFFPVMQDFVHDGKSIPEFTMFGATTNAGDVIKPLRDRFKYVLRLSHYSSEAIQSILMNNEQIKPEAAMLIAKRSFGIPRIAKNYLTQCSDQAVYSHPDTFEITIDDVNEAMKRMGVDDEGLDPTQRQILLYLYECGMPVGLETIAMVLDIEITNLKELHERILMYKEYVIRTRAGRVITKAGKQYLERKGLI